MRGVVISLPARDEREVIQDCLASVRATIRHARRLRLVDRVVVSVTAHRCTDDTAAVARRALRRLGLCGGVIVDDESTAVGVVRDQAARRGLARLPDTPSDSIWILSTDADTVVGVDWIANILDVATCCTSSCVVGLAALDQWRGSADGLGAYDAVLRAKFHDRGCCDGHDHVYGANLAVRADAYLAVGGFPHTAHGEDQQLVDTLSDAGYGVARTRRVSVTTSGRTEGRAEDGLAHLLWRLDNDEHGDRPSSVRPPVTVDATRTGLPADPDGPSCPADTAPGSVELADAATVGT